MNDNKKVPKIRFPEFSGEWEYKRIGDIFKLTRGQVLSSNKISKVKTKEMKYPVYSSQTKNDGLMGYYSEWLFDTSITWTTDGANAGTVNYREDKFYSTNVNGVLISYCGYSNKAVAEIINKLAWKFVSKVGNPKLMNNVMSDIKILIPVDIQEQQKIGNFFKKLDESISLQKNKLDNLKLQKKALLQKMFPKNGKTIPEIRFPEFSGDWEENKLGEVADITMGQSPSSTNYTDNPNDYILVQGNTDIKNGHVFPRVWTTQVTKIAEKGDLILSVRAPVGDIGKTSYNVVLGRGVAGIKGNEFIFQTLVNLKSIGYWNKLSTGSTFESINSSNIKDTYIHIPTLPEQKKIGNFFKKLDILILLNQQKLENLEKRKKGLLQKMFV